MQMRKLAQTNALSCTTLIWPQLRDTVMVTSLRYSKTTCQFIVHSDNKRDNHCLWSCGLHFQLPAYSCLPPPPPPPTHTHIETLNVIHTHTSKVRAVEKGSFMCVKVMNACALIHPPNDTDRQQTPSPPPFLPPFPSQQAQPTFSNLVSYNFLIVFLHCASCWSDHSRRAPLGRCALFGRWRVSAFLERGPKPRVASASFARLSLHGVRAQVRLYSV